jgi:hypothetical protein
MDPKTPVGGATKARISDDHRSKILQRFGEGAAVLRDVLYDDRTIDDEEFIFIDKQFEILQMAYLRWKRRHRPTNETVPIM